MKKKKIDLSESKRRDVINNKTLKMHTKYIKKKSCVQFTRGRSETLKNHFSSKKKNRKSLPFFILPPLNPPTYNKFYITQKLIVSAQNIYIDHVYTTSTKKARIF